MTYWAVEVNGETPSLAGWTFVAVLAPMTTDDGAQVNFVSTLPGESCPVEYRDRIGECDHCKATRRRKETFVVRHSDGATKCVGRQCIKDFLGYHADPHNLASWAECLAELSGLCTSARDEEWLGETGFRGERAWDLHRFLTLTACRIRLFGWVSKTKAREQMDLSAATASAVLELLTPPHPAAGEKARREWEAFCDKHTQESEDAIQAGNAIEWAKTINPEDNDYLHNVNVLARVGVTTAKTSGVAASIIVAYAKANEQELNRQQQAARPESNHIGEAGKRIACIKLTCERVIMNETAFGVTGIHKLTDDAGNDCVWFSSTGKQIDEGATVFAAASVKSHGEFRGRKQTVLTRIVVLEDDQAAAIQAKEAKKAAKAAKKSAELVPA